VTSREGGSVAKAGSILRRLMKAVSVLPFFLFGIWLLQVVYFPKVGTDKRLAAPKAVEKEGLFSEILVENEPVPRGHFHMVDEYILQPEPNPPICLTCHGTYAHSREKKLRAFLNFHSAFLSCTVCHVRNGAGGNRFAFTWVDHGTRAITTRVEGGYGKYPAKIYPITVSDKGERTVFRPVTEKAAQEYLKLKDKYTPDQVARAKAKLHRGISEKPVLCNECHRKDGYLDFTELGFPDKRIVHLVSTEVTGMIEKYQTFYLPSVIDFTGHGPSKSQ
jgi:hypothetical protein